MSLNKAGMIIIASAASGLFLQGALQACPVCGVDALNERSSQAYLASLFFMMSAPVLVLGSIGTWLYLRLNKTERIKR